MASSGRPVAKVATSLTFESALATDRAALWAWITDLRCLRREMMPYLRMGAPRGRRSLGDGPIALGQPLFFSVIWYGGVLPLDFSRLTLIELVPGQGFLEASPMGSMRAWRHRREILDAPGRTDRVVLRDTLAFEPRWLRAPTIWFVRRFFAHRHRVLRAAFPDREPGSVSTR